MADQTHIIFQMEGASFMTGSQARAVQQHIAEVREQAHRNELARIDAR